jgi:hypothetical protein
MGKTFKDRKDFPKYRSQKQKTALSKDYVEYKRHGVVEEPDDGDTCPVCGASTDFDCGHLDCRTCGWDDSGVPSLVTKFNEAA